MDWARFLGRVSHLRLRLGAGADRLVRRWNRAGADDQRRAGCGDVCDRESRHRRRLAGQPGCDDALPAVDGYRLHPRLPEEGGKVVPEPLGNEAQELFDQANALYESGQLEQAAAAYRRSIEIEPGRSEAHNNLGNTLLRIGKAREAVESFDRALQLQPNNPQALYNRGIALHNLRKFDGAVESYRRA